MNPGDENRILQLRLAQDIRWHPQNHIQIETLVHLQSQGELSPCPYQVYGELIKPLIAQQIEKRVSSFDGCTNRDLGDIDLKPFCPLLLHGRSSPAPDVCGESASPIYCAHGS